MAIALDVRDLLKHGAQMHEERERPVRLVVLLEPGAPDELLDAVKEQVRPRTSFATLAVEVVEPGFELVVEPTVDAIIAVAGEGGPGLKRAIDPPRHRAVPVAVVGLGDSNRPLADALVHPLADTLVSQYAEDVVCRDLADWFVDRLAGKRMALSYNFAFIRREVARDAVNTTAWQNALIGGVGIIPGADMPLMTANQAKMVLQIAAAYGERLGPDRVKELAAVVGGGFVFRTAARQILTFVPGFGWAIKAGIGFTGTMAMGKAAIEYFERGADLSAVGERVVEVRDAVVARVRGRGPSSRRGRETLAGVVVTESLEAHRGPELPPAEGPAPGG